MYLLLFQFDTDTKLSILNQNKAHTFCNIFRRINHQNSKEMGLSLMRGDQRKSHLSLVFLFLFLALMT